MQSQENARRDGRTEGRTEELTEGRADPKNVLTQLSTLNLFNFNSL